MSELEKAERCPLSRQETEVLRETVAGLGSASGLSYLCPAWSLLRAAEQGIMGLCGSREPLSPLIQGSLEAPETIGQLERGGGAGGEGTWCVDDGADKDAAAAHAEPWAGHDHPLHR